MAVSVLDTYLYSHAIGFKEMALYNFGRSLTWGSHSSRPDDPEDPMRPHAQWLALTMRNRFAEGSSMVETRDISVPTIEWTTDVRRKIQEEIPLIATHCITDEKGTYSVFVLSRKLDGKVGDKDYGDGITPVTLKLPFAAASEVTLHKLTGGPRANNIKARGVALVSRDLPAGVVKAGQLVIDESTGGVKGGMPPGTVFLYVIRKADG